METIVRRRLLKAVSRGVVAAGLVLASSNLFGQSGAVMALLARARSQDQAGHADLAAQSWQQVLLSDPNNSEALAGLARCAKLAGNNAEAEKYLSRLRQVDPHNASIGKVQVLASTQTQNAQLQEAARLAKAGRREDALRLYRSVWGAKPPDGDWALAFYDTEASTDAGHDEAIEGLRALARKYPEDARYSVTLGRILTYRPQTRTEGERMLQQMPQDAAAQTALRQALGWDGQNPGAAPEIRAYLKQHKDEQLEQSLAATDAHQPAANNSVAQTPAERAAFRALSANRADEAESLLLAILAEQPENPRVLAGLGFVAMKRSKFAEAITYLEKAAQHGPKDRAVEEALSTSRFWLTVQEGTTALNAGKLDEAETKYKAASAMRPSAPEPMQGLAGMYMKRGEPLKAIPVYQQILKTQPKSADGWRGMFAAQAQATHWDEALATMRRFPAAVQVTLARDPEYLRELASAYNATGQTVEAHQALTQALALPKGAQGATVEAQLAYANLLVADKQYGPAAGRFKEVLNADPDNVSAWLGLIGMQHQTGHDAEAAVTVSRMSPETYETALDDAGFTLTLAAIYQQENHLETARQLLVRAARAAATKGQSPSLALRLQLAAIYLQQNDPNNAFAMYRDILSDHPDVVDGWKGLLASLHQTHRDRDALAQLREIPVDVRKALEKDIDYEQTVARIYAETGHQPAALQIIVAIQAHFRAQHVPIPSEVDIQNAWLLYNTGDDRDLYRALMALGGRDDLADDQRRAVQTIWAQWSVRRAGQAGDAGDKKKSMEILSFAQQAFPDNVQVSKALAGGYLAAGDPKRSMAIYTSMDRSNASADDYQAMISAALAGANLREAELWLREGLEKFPNDAKVLAMAARFEQARGFTARAAEYWKASISAMPTAGPTSELAHLLDHPEGGHGARRMQGTDLARLLDPDSLPVRRAPAPALPSYRSTPQAESPAADDAGSLYGMDPMDGGIAPVTVHSGVAGRIVPEGEAGPGAGGIATETDFFAPPVLVSGPTEASLPAAPMPAGSDTAHEVRAVDARAPSDPRDSPLRFLSNSRSAPPTDAGHPSIRADRPVPIIFLHPAVIAPGVEMSPQKSQTASVISLGTEAVATSAPQAETAISDQQLQQKNLPPLRGPWVTEPPVHVTDQRQEAQQQLAVIEGGYSPWSGGNGYVSHRSGTPGFDQLTMLEAPFELSTTLGSSVRVTAVVAPSFLVSGVADGTSTERLGTAAVGAIPAAQLASGVGGEIQVTTENFGISGGTTPRGFLVSNFTGRANWRPGGGPFTFTFNRDAVRDSQLSYSGLHDPGSAGPGYAGQTWGGVIANSFNMQYARGDSLSGLYAGAGGQYLTGLNVQTNDRLDGLAGAYFRALTLPDTGNLTIGVNFFGMHYAHNLRFFTYGQGGYFSPSAYFLANAPFTFTGKYGNDLHYTVTGALGIQAFQEDTSSFFPLHEALQVRAPGPAPSTTIPPVFVNPQYPAQLVVGGNYDLHGEMSYHLMEKWFVGGFLSFNNTRDYSSQTAGFFIRYLIRPQYTNDDGPTGLFPYQGARPVMVP